MHLSKIPFIYNIGCWIFKPELKQEDGFMSNCLVLKTVINTTLDDCFLTSCDVKDVTLITFQIGVCLIHKCDGDDRKLERTQYGWDFYLLKGE